MKFKSTRGSIFLEPSEAIVKGIADDGGLLVPAEFPKVELDDILNMDYKELAFHILKKYFTDFSDGELLYCINNAYDDKFDSPSIAPLVERGNVSFLELFHGRTLAFKDMALSIFPHLLKVASKKIGVKEEIVILTATSGDTGKAALEAFSDVEGVKIIVFYPKEGVSEIQRLQMVTQEGKNTYVVAIEGNFDDAQRAAKEVLNDREFNKAVKENGYIFSSANSINIGRLFPQIVYYFYAYITLLKNGRIQKGEEINVVVPTGNFGNILAAYYAKKMGLNINKLICASNQNNILYDFITTGVHDVRRKFYTTLSPSMDILVSSNLERFLYDICGEDEKLISDLMAELKSGYFELPSEYKEELKILYAGYATDEETKDEIKNVFNNLSYLIDPHTAVAYHVYRDYLEDTMDNRRMVIVSTASPYKFVRTVYEAITDKESQLDDLELADDLSRITSTKIPRVITELKEKQILHRRTCKKDEVYKTIEEILRGDKND